MKTSLQPMKNISELSEDLESIQTALYNLKNQEKAIKDAILSIYEVQLGMAYIQKAEPFGTVNFEDEGLKITFNTPKKVTWDQEKLAEIYKEAGDEYIRVSYDVSETAYKGWNQAIKDELMAARTVEPGTITIKVERVK